VLVEERLRLLAGRVRGVLVQVREVAREDVLTGERHVVVRFEEVDEVEREFVFLLDDPVALGDHLLVRVVRDRLRVELGGAVLVTEQVDAPVVLLDLLAGRFDEG